GRDGERGPRRFLRDQRAGGDRQGEEDEAPDRQAIAGAIEQVERGKAREQPSRSLALHLLFAEEIEDGEAEGEREHRGAQRGGPDVDEEREAVRDLRRDR